MPILRYLSAALLAAVLLPIGFLVVCSLFVDTRREYAHSSGFYRSVLYGATAVALRLLRIRVHTGGLDRIPADALPLFVGNHRSNFDPIIEWQVLRVWRPAFLSKKENFRVPIFGRIIRKCCFMEIDRENPRRAMETINRAAMLLQQGEVSIGVYPEGTRSKSGELLPFHNGVFKIAQKAGAPIVVVAIRGTERIHAQAVLHRSEVYVDVVDVIFPEQWKSARTSDIGARVRGALLAALPPDGQEPVKNTDKRERGAISK